MRRFGSRRNWRQIGRVAATLLLLLVFALWVLQNAQPVRVHFLAFAVVTSLAWALIVACAAGFVAGGLATYFRRSPE